MLAQSVEEREAYAKLVLHTVIKCGNNAGVGKRGEQLQVPLLFVAAMGRLSASKGSKLRHIKGNSKLSLSPKAAALAPRVLRVCASASGVCCALYAL